MNYNVIDHKIKKVAYDLFRYWVKRAQDNYPDLNFAIYDETVLVEDLKGTIESSLVSLFQDEERDTTPFFLQMRDIGFVYGFIQGSLNRHWFHEYIVKRSEEYRQIVIIGAIQKYIQSDELSKINISQVYFELIRHDMNLRDFSDKFQEFDVDFTNLSLLNTGKDADDFELVATSLEKLRLTMIFKCANQKFPIYLPRIDRFFTNNQIKGLISDNEVCLRAFRSDEN